MSTAKQRLQRGDVDTESVEHHDGDENATRMVQSELETTGLANGKGPTCLKSQGGVLGGLDPKCRSYHF